MALFFISYDLRNKRDYQTLYDELKRFIAVRMLESCWCLKHSSATAKQLRDHFKKFVDGDDGIIVSQVEDWASSNAEKTPNDLK